MKRAPHGFTLVELLVALGIFIVLVLMAGPMYGEFMASAQVRNASESVLSAIRQAQAQAMKNNLPAVFTLDPAAGWTVTVDDPEKANTILFSRSHLFVDGSPLASIVVTPGTATQITFDGLGRLIPNVDGSETIGQVDLTHKSEPAARALRVVVSSTGTGVGTLLCDPATSTSPTACP